MLRMRHLWPLTCSMPTAEVTPSCITHSRSSSTPRLMYPAQTRHTTSLISTKTKAIMLAEEVARFRCNAPDARACAEDGPALLSPSWLLNPSPHFVFVIFPFVNQERGFQEGSAVRKANYPSFQINHFKGCIG